MYISVLRLDARSRRAMTEAGRPYELHRSLLSAFPDREAGGPGRVLFRLDTDGETGEMSILVQSEKEPDWSRLNGAAGFIREYKSKQFNPSFVRGQVLCFRLRANPTRREKTTGKRLGILREEDQLAWLKRKGEGNGFDVLSAVVTPEGLAHDNMTDRTARAHKLSLVSVRFDGAVRVRDPEIFRVALGEGIGSGKGFGFGLLSVARVKEALT